MFSRKTKSLTSPDKVASWIGGTTLVDDSSGIFDDATKGAHNRRRTECKECGGGSICQHARILSKSKTCTADKDESMPLAGSRALRHTNTSFCPGQCLLPPSWIFRSKHRRTEIEISCAHGLVQDWIKSPPFRVAPIDRLLCTCPRPPSHHFKRRRRYLTGATVSQPSLFGIWDSPLNPTDSGHFHETAQAPQ